MCPSACDSPAGQGELDAAEPAAGTARVGTDREGREGAAGAQGDINEQQHLLREQQDSTEQRCCSCEFTSEQDWEQL